MAGRINPEWLHNARCNETEDCCVEDWLATAGNYRSVDIDDSGAVCANGRWLTQAQIDRLCFIVDRGV